MVVPPPPGVTTENFKTVGGKGVGVRGWGVRGWVGGWGGWGVSTKVQFLTAYLCIPLFRKYAGEFQYDSLSKKNSVQRKSTVSQRGRHRWKAKPK